MPGDVRLTQLARMLGLPHASDEAAIRAAAAANLARLVDALIEEAAASDDVTDPASARAYLEARLAFLGDLIPGPVAGGVREGFEDRLQAWAL
jgi:hypothetical protein